MAEISICSMVPSADDLLALETEELAGVLLEHLCSIDERSPSFNRYNFFLPGQSPSLGYAQEYRNRIDEALTEAWGWLGREVLIAPRPGDHSGNFMFVTRRGRLLANRQNFEAYRHAALLPKNLLHALVVQKVYPAFLRGEYDTAIFQAFREVEIAVRKAGGYSDVDLGVPLMRAAFNVPNGPLTDGNAAKAEQEATSNLFAGAIGRYNRVFGGLKSMGFGQRRIFGQAAHHGIRFQSATCDVSRQLFDRGKRPRSGSNVVVSTVNQNAARRSTGSSAQMSSRCDPKRP